MMKNSLLLSVLCLVLVVSCAKSPGVDAPPPPPTALDAIPIVFHVLYEDEKDIYQNLPTKFLQDRLKQLNNYFAAKMYPDSISTPVNIRFEMAQYDPTGKKLAEAGINRVQYAGANNLSADAFLKSKHPFGSVNYNLFWDLNKYVNVWIFGFSEANVAGIAYLPYTTSSNPIPGLSKTDAYFNQQPDYMHGIAINNKFFVYEEIGPNAFAHEMGHYFGLLHAFDEKGQCTNSDDASDDFCSDTPKYDRTAYEISVGERSANQSFSVVPNHFMETKAATPESYFYRTSCSGKKFRSANLMDYFYGDLYRLTPQQRDRIEAVMRTSPLIPRLNNAKAAQTFVYTGDLPEGIMIR